MVAYKYNLKPGSVKKIDDLGYGWGIYLAKFEDNGHPFNMTILTKNSMVMFVNKFFVFFQIYSQSGEDLSGKITPNQLVKGKDSHIYKYVPNGYVMHVVPSTVIQKFDHLNYFPDN